MIKPHLISYGSQAWMLRWDDADWFHDRLITITQKLHQSPPDNMKEFIFGYQTLLLIFTSATAKHILDDWLDSLNETTLHPVEDQAITHQIPVCYQGQDIEALAQQKGLKVDQVIQLHSERLYTVYFLGFSPGFPYLGKLNDTLHTPRKSTPLTRIEPGSVAIGGSHTGIYSVASPGGWHIIGKTNVSLFRVAESHHELASEDVFYLKAGDRVQLTLSSLCWN
ncbi:MAG: 5-oxoprolinase subunit PxpB [Verrucomicrobiota bacterium]